MLVVTALLGLLGMHGLPAHAAVPAAAPAHAHAAAPQNLDPHAAAPDRACADHTACVATMRAATALAPPAAGPTSPVPVAAPLVVTPVGADVASRAPPDRVDLVALGISRT
ncbi:hypothetical protein GCM10027047_03670 [Rhodococcus aerolatus]